MAAVMVNANKPQLWKSDIARSVDLFNDWFLRFAPAAYRSTRVSTTERVQSALVWTGNLSDISIAVLRRHPEVVQMLRMTTAPPIARDRLAGLAYVPKSFVTSLEVKKRIPPRMASSEVDSYLSQIGQVIDKLADRDLFTWLESEQAPDPESVYRASSVVADRLCGAVADPIIRNAQEQRQLAAIESWLTEREYRELTVAERGAPEMMPPGTFATRFAIKADLEGGIDQVTIPIDMVVMAKESTAGSFPILIEAKSAGDYTNVNKRRKEEATKVRQLKQTYGDQIRFVLFLNGYFDSGYLGYEAAEGIDWVWEHRIDDLTEFGL